MIRLDFLKGKFLHRLFLAGAVFMLLLSLAVQGLYAQVLYGSLTGTVHDSSGAVVPNATVSITNVGTGQVFTATTDTAGIYLRPDMQEGLYDVRITAPGFKTYTLNAVNIVVNAARQQDVTLEVGQTAENVIVSAETLELQTDKTDLHTDLSAADVTNLPLGHYRNFQSLINLVPGATPGINNNSLQTSPERSLSTQVNGVNENNNNTRIDGITSVYLWLPDHSAYIPPAESIQTVNISTNDFNAEQGMAGGVVTNVITKSGTNQLHGSAFALNTNAAVEAKNFFNTGVKPLTNVNIDGFTVGGPIKKDKLFFFQSWESLRERQGYTAVMTVPTAAQRAGDFSGFATSIYDPTTGTATGTGRSLISSGGKANVIPASRISPIALAIQSQIPLPNGPGVTANYTNSGVQVLNRNSFDTKVNYNVSDATSAWAKYSLMRANTACPGGLGAAGGVPLCAGNIGVSTNVTQVGDLGFTRIFTPTLVWDGTLGYLRMGNNITGFDYGQTTPLTTLGIPGTNGGNSAIINSGAPQFVITGYSQVGGDTDTRPYIYNQDTYSITQNIGWSRSKHYLRFGFEGMRHHMNFYEPDGGGGGGPQGQFDFTEGVTGLNGGPAQTQYNAYADFLLGLPQEDRETLQFERYTTYDYEYGAYAQDRWQVTPALTLSYGIRYEIYPMMTRSGRGGIEEYNPATNLVALGGVGGNPKGLGISTSHKLFAPRLGVAYRLNKSTVVRAGFGISYDPLALARPLRGWYPLTNSSLFTSPNAYTPYATFAQGIPAIPAPDFTQASLPVPLGAQERYIDGKEIKRGYAESWNLVVQRELPWHVLASVAYVGTQTIHQFVDLDVNAGVPGGGTAGQPLYAAFKRTAITWAWNGRYTANYNALQVAFDRAFSDGLTLKGAYTYSRAMDMTDQDGWAQLIFYTPSQIPRNYARAGFDIPENLQVASMYQLPFGQGKKYFNSGVPKWILGGWEWNSIFSARSGLPFTVTASSTSLNAPDNTQTADQVKPKVKKLGGSGYGQFYYDPTAFAAVTAARFGTSGRDSLYASPWVDLDTSVFRNFPIKERLQLQLRAEAFNSLNTPHFSAPNANVSVAGFMTTTAAQQDQRNLRFGARLDW
jgi:hypothetical protein